MTSTLRVNIHYRSLHSTFAVAVSASLCAMDPSPDPIILNSYSAGHDN